MVSLDELLETLVSAIANRDLATTLGCFAVNAVVLGSEAGEEARGIGHLQSFFERGYGKEAACRIRFDDRIWTLRQDQAWVISNDTGSEPGQDAANYRLVAIFEKPAS
ncbi:MAG: hypothetical protein P4L46_01450 [Fimbriimonas sp.]|nr:hypothetical protein [Fimbriimonas sp.]